MIKLTFALRRLPHLSREDFQRYWRDTHAGLVKKHRDALRIERYVQVHTVDHSANEGLRNSRQAPEAFDGVAEIWWKDADAMVAAFAEPEAMRAGQELLEDERRFIDLKQSPIWLAEEHVVIGE